jgi:hypothetical protein
MVDHTIERIKGIIETIVTSYDKLKEFEKNSCQKEQLENELINIRDTAGEIPSLLAQIFKEHPEQMQSLLSIAPLFKMPFVTTISLMIPLIKQQQSITDDWIKIQSSMAIALMNENSAMDALKAILTFFR